MGDDGGLVWAEPPMGYKAQGFVEVGGQDPESCTV